MVKRNRARQVSFRLSDKEYALLQKKLSASQLSIIIISDFLALLGELKRQGVNLNQLARRANQFSPLSEHEIITTLQQCQNSYRKLIELSTMSEYISAAL